MINVHCLPMNPDWVEEMLMFAQRKDVCAVSPKVYFENNLIAYAGIALEVRDNAKVKFLCQGINGAEQGYEAMLRHVRNTTAAWKDCCMISKNAWRNLGGLKEDVPGYEIIDYCLNGEKQGLWTVWTCFAEFSYSKALTIEVDDTEIQKFISKWESREYNFTVRSLNEICQKLNLKFNISFDSLCAKTDYKIVRWDRDYIAKNKKKCNRGKHGTNCGVFCKNKRKLLKSTRYKAIILYRNDVTDRIFHGPDICLPGRCPAPCRSPRSCGHGARPPGCRLR